MQSAPLSCQHGRGSFAQYLAEASLAGKLSSTASSTPSQCFVSLAWASAPAGRTWTGASAGPDFLLPFIAAAFSLGSGAFGFSAVSPICDEGVSSASLPGAKSFSAGFLLGSSVIKVLLKPSQRFQFGLVPKMARRRRNALTRTVSRRHVNSGSGAAAIFRSVCNQPPGKGLDGGLTRCR